jgi:hypothetical protein
MKLFNTKVYAFGAAITFSQFNYLVSDGISKFFDYNGDWEYDEVADILTFDVFFEEEDLWEASSKLNEAAKELEEEQISITWDKPYIVE